MDYKKNRLEFTNSSFREMLVKTLGNKCCNCGSEKNIEYHHIVPLINGGTNNLSNIVPICEECHNKAHDKKYLKERGGGRPNIISFEDAEPFLERYFNQEIGTKECKLLLGLSEKNKSTWYKLKNEYKKKYNISNDFYNRIDITNAQKQKLRKVSAK